MDTKPPHVKKPSPPPTKFKNIGDVLLDMGAIDLEGLQKGLKLQGRRLGEILVEEGIIDPAVLGQALKIQAKMATESLLQQGPSPAGAYVRLPVPALHRLLERFDQISEKDIVSEVDFLKFEFESLLLKPLILLQKKAEEIVVAENTDKKKLRLIWKDQDFDIDVNLFHEMSDMLVHLLRNAVAHGIEDVEARRLQGKPLEGRIDISVDVDGNDFVFTIKDNGQGIETAKVLRRAHSMGLIPKTVTQLTIDEVKKLIFTPGFSTAGEVNLKAGMGIGLDVVEAAAVRLGGQVTMTSVPKLGTAFSVRVPLTFARIPMVCARVYGQWVGFRTEKIKAVRDLEYLRSVPVDEQKKRVRNFDFLFDQKSLQPENTGSLDYFLEDPQGILWAVEEVQNPQKLMVRGVPTPIQSSYLVSGTIQMNDPKGVALFLDLKPLK